VGWQSKKKTRLELREGVKTRAHIKMCKVLVAEEEVRLKVPWGTMCGELDAWKQTLQSRIRPNMLWTNIGLRCIVGCCGCIVLDGG